MNKYNGLIEIEFAEGCLFRLYEVINEESVINCYLKTSQDLIIGIASAIRI